MIQILLSLPSGWVANSLKELINRGIPDASVILVGDLAQALTVVANHSDLDLFLWAPAGHPDVRGALHHLATTAPKLPLLVLLPRRNMAQEAGVMQAGARGVIWPGMSETAVLDTIRLVLQGGRAALPTATVPSDLDLPKNGFQSVPPIGSSRPLPELRRYRLTARQIEVLQLIGEGLTNKDIARRLGLQEGTVKVHLRQILKQLGVKNRTQAALLLRATPGGAQPPNVPAEAVTSLAEAAPQFDVGSDK